MNERARDMLGRALDALECGADAGDVQILAAKAVRLLSIKWRRSPKWLREGVVVESRGGRRSPLVAWAAGGSGHARSAAGGERYEVVRVYGAEEGEPQVFDLCRIVSSAPILSPGRTEYDGYGRFPWRLVR